MRKAASAIAYPFICAGIMALAFVLSVILSPIYAFGITKSIWHGKAKVSSSEAQAPQ